MSRISGHFLSILLATFGLIFSRAEAQSDVSLLPVSTAVAKTDAHLPLEKETFALINQYRIDKGLSELKWDTAITEVARAHSRDMATGEVDFGHDGFGDRIRLLKKTLVGFRGAGENVFMTDDPREIAHAAVAVWLKSPPHLHNIRGDYNYSGMGIWVNDQGVIYFTQIFILLQPPDNEVQASPTPVAPFTSPYPFLSATATRPAP